MSGISTVQLYCYGMRLEETTHLISKIVFVGFIAAWFFAASPINRSWSVNETKEGVVKLPCSLATKGTRAQ